MSLNLVVLVVALAASALVGFAARRYNGHFRGAAPAPVLGPEELGGGTAVPGGSSAGSAGRAAAPSAVVVTLAEIRAELGERATLLQFSSAFCAPCRATRRTLADVAAVVPGVAHVEVDAEHHLDLVRRLGVMRTPTTFVLDTEGQVLVRASGAPTKAAVVAALGRAVP